MEFCTILAYITWFSFPLPVLWLFILTPIRMCYRFHIIKNHANLHVYKWFQYTAKLLLFATHLQCLSTGGACMTGTYCWEVLNALILSFVNLLSFNYRRHNQNYSEQKRYSQTCLFKVVFMRKKRNVRYLQQNLELNYKIPKNSYILPTITANKSLLCFFLFNFEDMWGVSTNE